MEYLFSYSLVYMLHGLGIATGVNLPALVKAGHYICDHLQRQPNSKLGRLPEYREEASAGDG